MQRELEFDMATLNACISALKPKRSRTLFRGLLMTAANEPHHVTDIDTSGFVLMTAPIEKVANWSGVDVRTIQRCRTALADIVDHDGGPNTPSHWCFSLRAVMPESAIEWFRDLVENTRTPPRHFQNATPAFCATYPGILRAKAQNAGVAFSNLTSSSFSFNTASLATLAESFQSLGIAFQGDDWQSLQVDDAALTNPDAIAAIARSGGADEFQTRQIFCAAIVSSQAGEWPWNYFRNLLVSGIFRTKKFRSQVMRQATTMLNLTNGTDAGEIVPTTADEAWARVLAAVRQFSPIHQLREIRETLGESIHAAVRASGGYGKIASANPQFQRDNRSAFVDAYTAGQTIAASCSHHAPDD